MYGSQHSKASDRVYRTLSVQVRPDLHHSIEQIARSEGETIAAITRRLIRAGLEQRQAEAQ